MRYEIFANRQHMYKKHEKERFFVRFELEVKCKLEFKVFN